MSVLLSTLLLLLLVLPLSVFVLVLSCFDVIDAAVFVHVKLCF